MYLCLLSLNHPPCSTIVPCFPCFTFTSNLMVSLFIRFFLQILSLLQLWPFLLPSPACPGNVFQLLLYSLSLLPSPDGGRRFSSYIFSFSCVNAHCMCVKTGKLHINRSSCSLQFKMYTGDFYVGFLSSVCT